MDSNKKQENGSNQVIEYSKFLDNEKENILLIKLILSKDATQIIEFVIIYLTLINNKPIEIVKYDVSRRENLNVHKYYHKQEEKSFLNREVNFETVDEIMEYITKNWRKMKLQYEENQ